MNRGNGSFQRTRATLDRCDQIYASEALSAECIKLRSDNIMELRVNVWTPMLPSPTVLPSFL